MKKNKWLFFFALLIVVMVLPITAQAKIKINKAKAKTTVGKTIQLKVTGTKRKVRWSSSNKNVATVKGGVVTGKKKGTATITARSGKLKANCKVKVEETGKEKREDLSKYMGYRMANIKEIFNGGTSPMRFVAETAFYDLGWLEFSYGVPTVSEKVFCIALKKATSKYSLLGVTINMKRASALKALEKTGWKIINDNGSNVLLSKSKEMTDTSNSCSIEFGNGKVSGISYTENSLR